MRLLFFFLFAVSTSTISALECYLGVIPSDSVPKLTQCAANEKCCFAGVDHMIGKVFGCESQCPDFNGRAEAKSAVSDENGHTNYCQTAEGNCKFT